MISTPWRIVQLLSLAFFLGCEGDPVVAEQPVALVDAGPPAAAHQALGQLEAPSGQITVEHGGQRRPATPGPLFEGDVIETGEDGAGVLRFGGERVVELGPDGRFEVGAEGDGVMLTVARGLVLTRVRGGGAAPEGGGVTLTITTPFGLTRVGSAELSLRVGDSSASVDVKLGEIELVSRSGEVTKLGAGRKGLLGAARELPEIALTIVMSGGRAEVKSNGAKAFVAINPKAPPVLKSGDLVRVKEGKVRLVPEGSATRLTLFKGAEVGVEQTRRGSGEEITGLELRRGEVEVGAPAGQVTRLAVAAGLTLVSDLGGQYALRKTGSGFEVDAFTGDLRIERDGEAPTVVPGGQSALVPVSGAASVRADGREVVALPSRPGLRLYHQGLQRVALTWEDEGADVWRVQLATDAAFTNVLRDGLVHQPFLNVPALPRGAWYWRVSRGEVEVAKGHALFAPEPKAVDLSRLRNVVPEGAETTTIYFQDRDKPPVVNFTWTRGEGAARSTVKVYREGQLQSPVAERTVAENQVSLPENTLVEGRYLWSVTPLDAKGGELKGGRMNKLHLVYDNAVAALVIKTPKNGDRGGATLRTTGVAPVGSRLFINGRSIALDDQARFDTNVSPLPGGRLVYRLVQGGTEAWTVRSVRGP